MSIKVTVWKQSEQFSPDGGGVQELFFNTLEEAVKSAFELSAGEDLRISCAHDNSNIVGLLADYDIEILDGGSDEE